jgi:hypothetical protein
MTDLHRQHSTAPHQSRELVSTPAPGQPAARSIPLPAHTQYSPGTGTAATLQLQAMPRLRTPTHPERAAPQHRPAPSHCCASPGVRAPFPFRCLPALLRLPRGPNVNSQSASIPGQTRRDAKRHSFFCFFFKKQPDILKLEK